MRVVSKKTLVEYYGKHAVSKTALEDWYYKVGKAKSMSLMFKNYENN